MIQNQLGCCGLKCTECPVFIATVNDDDVLRKQYAKLWSELYADYIGEELKFKDMNCDGCRSEDRIFVGCSKCMIRECSYGKEFKTCASCDEFEKCEMLNGFYSVPDHKSAKENLEKIRINRQ